MLSIVLDVGNTRVKVGIYNLSKLVEVKQFSLSDNDFLAFIHQFDYQFALVSSVVDDVTTKTILDNLKNPLLLSAETKIPITVEYDSLQTLGKDRLANAIYASQHAKGNALVIDVGTCIKFDFVAANGIYQGGSIAPGLKMRFVAMYEHTGKLPNIKNFKPTKLIGDSTVNSMMSGVLNGAKYEIEGMIYAFQSKYKDLTIFATGGDVRLLNLDSSLPIIYDEHLTINGLYQILQCLQND